MVDRKIRGDINKNNLEKGRINILGIKLKKQSGITLIALIITIIIMLILAGVAISALMDGEGLFGKTQLAADEYSQSVQNEADKITGLMNDIDTYLNGFPQSSEPYPNGSWTGTVNEPKIEGTGLIPVRFDENGNTIELTAEQAKNTVWYDYVDTSVTGNENKSKWANAVTKNNQGEITGYFVWIPRYEYKITYNDPNDKKQGGIIDINFISTDTTTPTTNDYIIHPAFTDESATTPVYKNGGWKEEIPGFWVAKFEAGFAGGGMNDLNNDVAVVESGLTYTGVYSNTATNYYGPIISGTTKMKLPVFLPKTGSYNYINIGDCFNISREIQNASTYYGLNNTKADSHLIKNSEWGAVAYLAHSKYGRNGTEITINNVVMGAISELDPVTGYAGESVSKFCNYVEPVPAEELDSILQTSDIETNPEWITYSYAWNTENGGLAGSTGNMYGVFDLSGGAHENTAGYLNLSSNAKINNYGGTFAKTGTNITRTTSTEYASVYIASNNGVDSYANYSELANVERKGEAIWETSNEDLKSWNNDAFGFPRNIAVFTLRSGDAYGTDSTGLFYFSQSNGGHASNAGFRVVLFPL